MMRTINTRLGDPVPSNWEGPDPYLVDCRCKRVKCKENSCGCELCESRGRHAGHEEDCAFPAGSCSCEHIPKEKEDLAADRDLDMRMGERHETTEE